MRLRRTQVVPYAETTTTSLRLHGMATASRASSFGTILIAIVITTINGGIGVSAIFVDGHVVCNVVSDIE